MSRLAKEQIQLGRTNSWLEDQLEMIWERHFLDVPRMNTVDIEFARRWKTRLGCIALSENQQNTYIGINRLLSDEAVPSEICLVTIAHELVHYAHGFGSPLPQKYRHPHRGNVVNRELMARGLGAELSFWESWIDNEWFPFYYSRVGSIKAIK